VNRRSHNVCVTEQAASADSNSVRAGRRHPDRRVHLMRRTTTGRVAVATSTDDNLMLADREDRTPGDASHRSPVPRQTHDHSRASPAHAATPPAGSVICVDTEPGRPPCRRGLCPFLRTIECGPGVATYPMREDGRSCFSSAAPAASTRLPQQKHLDQRCFASSVASSS
jgi:hypothetical protein